MSEREAIPEGEPASVTAQRRADYQKLLAEWRQIKATAPKGA